MKAIQHEKYGPPDVIELKEVDKPIPKDNEVLVKIHAASVNPLDWHFLRGTPQLMRLSSGLTRPKNKMLGADIAGRVEAVGTNVKQFKAGDEIFADVFLNGLGAFAEYICVGENGAIALKPANTTFKEAAAIPLAAVTALQGLRDKGKVRHGQRVLINGASGGVGTFAVQIAKSFGAVVTAVCSTRSVEMVKSLGADHVIDYTQEDFTASADRANGQGYDLIIDNVGNHSVSDYERVLSPGGKCVIIGYTSPALLLQHMFGGLWASMKGSKQIGLMGTVQPNQKDLIVMKELVEAGKVVPVIDKYYPLRETTEAIRYLEEGHARGKIIITVEHHPET